MAKGKKKQQKPATSQEPASTTSTTVTNAANPDQDTAQKKQKRPPEYVSRRCLSCCVESLQRFLNGIVLLLIAVLCLILTVAITSPFPSWHEYWETHLWSKLAPASVPSIATTTDALSVASLFFDTPAETPAPPAVPSIPSTLQVQWHLPIGCDYSGFFVEGLTFAVGLSPLLPNFSLEVGACSDRMLGQATPLERAVLLKTSSPFPLDILILHKLPDQPYHTPSTRPRVLVGRQMTEETRLPLFEAQQAMLMDEVWVPTHFHYNVFVNSGVDASILQVMPEPMDTVFYNPAATTTTTTTGRQKTTTFLSIFKWEHRKGWDVLLTAYWNAFTQHDHVQLILKTYKPAWMPGEKNVTLLVQQYAQKYIRGLPTTSRVTSLADLPPVKVIPRNDMSKHDLRALYKQAQAFVLPTRGEGWCLPCVEAMSMKLPIIVTNFSGPTAYMRPDNGYPITFTANADGTAEPDVGAVVAALRSVAVNPIKAKMKGHKGRLFVVSHYSSAVVAKKVLERLNVLWSLSGEREGSGERDGKSGGVEESGVEL